jgi:hypothetical protein
LKRIECWFNFFELFQIVKKENNQADHYEATRQKATGNKTIH